MRLAIALVVCVGCTSSSATPDTCTEGETFDALHLVNGLEGNTFRVGWTTPIDGAGAELPAAYFDNPQVSGAESASVTGVNEITVELGDLSDTLDVALTFPDRRDFTTCTHPGMHDTYGLTIHLVFSSDHQAITGATFDETLETGAI